MRVIVRPYEVLLRFADNGAPSGAHVQHLRRVEQDDGTVVVPEHITDPQPLPLTSALVAAALEAMQQAPG